MKFPPASVIASFVICLRPSRTNETSAPANGLPLLSFTEPVIVARLEAFGVPALASSAKAVKAIRDRLRLLALVMLLYPPGVDSQLERLILGSTTQYCRLFKQFPTNYQIRQLSVVNTIGPIGRMGTILLTTVLIT